MVCLTRRKVEMSKGQQWWTNPFWWTAVLHRPIPSWLRQLSPLGPLAIDGDGCSSADGKESRERHHLADPPQTPTVSPHHPIESSIPATSSYLRTEQKQVMWRKVWVMQRINGTNCVHATLVRRVAVFVQWEQILLPSLCLRLWLICKSQVTLDFLSANVRMCESTIVIKAKKDRLKGWLFNWVWNDRRWNLAVKKRGFSVYKMEYSEKRRYVSLQSKRGPETWHQWIWREKRHPSRDWYHPHRTPPDDDKGLDYDIYEWIKTVMTDRDYCPIHPFVTNISHNVFWLTSWQIIIRIPTTIKYRRLPSWRDGESGDRAFCWREHQPE